MPQEDNKCYKISYFKTLKVLKILCKSIKTTKYTIFAPYLQGISAFCTIHTLLSGAQNGARSVNFGTGVHSTNKIWEQEWSTPTFCGWSAEWSAPQNCGARNGLEITYKRYIFCYMRARYSAFKWCTCIDGHRGEGV